MTSTLHPVLPDRITATLAPLSFARGCMKEEGDDLRVDAVEAQMRKMGLVPVDLSVQEQTEDAGSLPPLFSGLPSETLISAEEVALCFLLGEWMRPRDGEDIFSLITRWQLLQEMGTGLLLSHVMESMDWVDPTRKVRYRAMDWVITTVSLDDLAPWPQMGGMSAQIVHGSTQETAMEIDFAQESELDPGVRALRLLHDQVGQETAEAWLSVLPPIALPSSVLHPGHPDITTAYSLDDGSHRAIALAAGGAERVRVLLGTPRV